MFIQSGGGLENPPPLSLRRQSTKAISAKACNDLLRCLRALAQLRDISGSDRGRTVVPSSANEREHVGDLLIVEHRRVLRHRIRGGDALYHEVVRTVQRDVDQ